jgi:predicted RNA-binding Zn ribbon-like protein
MDGNPTVEFEFVAGNLALDFANTEHNHGAAEPQNDLRAFSDLLDWGRQAGLLQENENRRLLRRAQSRPAAAAQDFRRALGLRAVLYDVFSSIALTGKADPQALRRFNSLLQRALAAANLQRTGETYELGWQEQGQIDRMLSHLIHAATSLLTSDQLGRLRQCAGESCTWLFVDTSRNGKRRWCDMRHCGNRAKVRRFRQRTAAAAR